MKSDSRELDIDILEKVFGFPRKKVKLHDDGWHEYIPSGKPWRTHQIDAQIVPHYSADARSCHRVILKMSEKYHWEIKSPFFPGQPWFAGLTPHNMTGWNGSPDYQEQGATMMEAVCKCALKVISGKPDLGE